MRNPFISELGQVLILQLKHNLEDFEFGEYSMIHKPSKQDFWVANGFMFLNMNSQSIFGFIEKWVIMRHINRARNKLAANQLKISVLMK